MILPDKIRNMIRNKTGKQDVIGLSGASVYLFDDMVLKVQPVGSEAEHEIIMLKWLQNRLPVPEIIEHQITNKCSYLLMGKCRGEMACSEAMLNQPKAQFQLLSDTLQQIWSVDWHDCPYDCRLDRKLQIAEQNVVNGTVDTEMCEPDTFGANGFRDPEALLYWLYSNQPKEELALSHGDFCLPNIFFHNGKLAGLIDLGRCGIADQWCDIALCYRSVKHNCAGIYANQVARSFNANEFFQILNIKPDWDKIRYYLLLDELL